jgi:hypothetical protein
MKRVTRAFPFCLFLPQLFCRHRFGDRMEPVSMAFPFPQGRRYFLSTMRQRLQEVYTLKV